MNKVLYKDIQDSTPIVYIKEMPVWGDNTLEVSSYLPVVKKNELIAITLEDSTEFDGTFNPVKIKCNFIVNLFLAYTNIEVDYSTINKYTMYDQLYTCGYIKTFLDTMDNVEYMTIKEMLDESIKIYTAHAQSLVGVVDQISKIVDSSLGSIKDISETFNIENLKTLNELHGKVK